MPATFTKTFGLHAIVGDSISCDVEGFTITARIERDDDGRTPFERMDGFWPSKDKDAAGYVLPENYEAEMIKAQRIYNAWLQDEWFYCGVVLSVSRAGITLEEDAASLWGIECNYPGSDNGYLTVTANDLLAEALAEGKAIRTKIIGTNTKPPQPLPDDAPLSVVIADGLDAAVDGRGWNARHQAAQDLANAAPNMEIALKLVLHHIRAKDNCWAVMETLCDTALDQIGKI